MGVITTDESGKRTKSRGAASVNFLELQDPWHASIRVNGKKVNFRVDTGADVTVVPSRYFTKNSPLIQMSNKALHLIERVHTLQSPGSDQNSVKNEFLQLVKGLRTIKSIYKIRMKKHAKPCSIATPRRLPLPMRQKVQEELMRMEEEDVIPLVKNPTEWCAPIVVEPKSNGKVKICVDLTKLSESVRREIFPLPSTDQQLAQFSCAKLFSKLDCNSGFNQIPLDESRN